MVIALLFGKSGNVVFSMRLFSWLSCITRLRCSIVDVDVSFVSCGGSTSEVALEIGKRDSLSVSVHGKEIAI